MPATAKTPALEIPLARARAHWHRSQGLAAPPKSSLDELVAETGWLRTLGGADVYIAARARRPGLRRAELDQAVAEGRLSVTPAVRSCIYLVPRAHLPLALRIAEEAWRKKTEREVEKAGSSWKEVSEVAAAAREALREPLSTDALRKALPAGTLRSFGDRGKKIGLSSALPVALRDLEFAGTIERTLETGRLDSERYVWRRTSTRPAAGAKVPSDATLRLAQLAEIFFAHAGPATPKDFSEWAAIGLRDAEAALSRAALVPVAVDGYAKNALVLERHLTALRRPAEPSGSVNLLSFEDNYLTLHGGPAPLTDPAHHGRKVDAWGSSKPSTLGEVKHLAARSVLVDGLLVAFWEFDPDNGSVVLGPLEPLSPRVRKEAEARAEDMAGFLRDDMGHGRSFSLDTDDALRDRARRVRAMSAATKGTKRSKGS